METNSVSSLSTGFQDNAVMATERDESVEKTGLYYARLERSMTQEQLAKKTGVAKNTVIRLENGIPPKGMKFTKQWAKRFEPVLNYPASLLLFWDEESAKRIFADPNIAPRVAMFQTAQVKTLGAVAAGVWRDVGQADSVVYEDLSNAMPPHPDYPLEAQYDLVVVGTSINRVAMDGYRLRVVDLAQTGGGYSAGDLVIVERTEGNLIETTAKRVRRRATGEEELWPDSDDPQWQTPLVAEREKGSVRVIARVLYSYKSARAGS
jgi:transcriptional regulator with XRE-family HTH domain